MKVVAQTSDGDALLVIDGDDSEGQILHLSESRLGEPLPLAGILARDDWEVYTGPQTVLDGVTPGAKTTVTVRPYVREGHPVHGYTREQAAIERLAKWRKRLGFDDALLHNDSNLIRLPDDLGPLVHDLRIDRPLPERKGPVAQEILGGHKDTKAKFTDEHGRYLRERKALHDAIVSDALTGHRPQAKKHALILAGGNATGKSRALGKQKDAMPPDAVQINFDDVKKRLPEFTQMADQGEPYATDGTHFESADVTRRILQESLDGDLNVAIDASGDGKAGLADTLALLKRRGYETNVLLVDAPFDDAYRSMLQRGIRTGRFVPVPIMRRIHSRVMQRHLEWRNDPNLDHFAVYRRDGETLVKVAEGGGGDYRVLDAPLYTRMLAKADNVDA